MDKDKIVLKISQPDEKKITIVWHDLDGRRLPDKDWKQVHVISNYRGKVILVYFEDLDMVHIPGGHIEKGETIEQALKREVEEETGGFVVDWEPIGYQERIDESSGCTDYQLRVYAKVKNIMQEKEDYDGKRVKISLVDIDNFLESWGWENPIGDRIYQIIRRKMEVSKSDSEEEKAREAEEMALKIKPILERYGEVEFVGGYAWGTLFDRDIDISLWVNKNNMKNDYKKIINDLADMDGAFEIKARNLIDFNNSSKKGRNLKCMLIMAKIFNPKQRLWNIDICLFDKDDPSVQALPFDRDTVHKIENMSKKQKNLIQEIKKLITDSGLYLKGRSSADIYKKVVSNKIEKPEDYIPYANELIKNNENIPKIRRK